VDIKGILSVSAHVWNISSAIFVPITSIVKYIQGGAITLNIITIFRDMKILW